MANITLTIPDAVLPRVVAALCSAAGLPASNANAKQAVIDHIKATVVAVEYSAAVKVAVPIPEPDTTGIVA